MTHPLRLPRDFTGRALFVAGLGVGLVLLWQLLGVAILAFASIIVAVALRSLAAPIERHTPLRGAAALACAVLTVVAVVGLTGWLAGHLIASQFAGLATRLPSSAADLRRHLEGLPLGPQIAAELTSTAWLSSGLQGVAGRLGGYALTAVGALANLVLVIIAGVFLAANAQSARAGAIRLLPHAARSKAEEALEASGRALRLWLLGTLADMVVVGVLATIGAAIVGLPSPAALGLLAGVAAFVPIIGTITAVIPGLLLAFQFGAETVGWTVVMYVAVQQIEGHLVYPFIQRRAVDLPPYLSLFSVVIFGVLFGVVGVILGTPLLVVTVTLVKLLYQRDVLGEEVSLPGAAHRK